MYHVAEHRFGRKLIRSGPMSGCMGFHEHEWKTISSHRRKADAIAAADACGCHATVVKGCTSKVIYSNGKAPGERS